MIGVVFDEVTGELTAHGPAGRVAIPEGTPLEQLEWLLAQDDVTVAEGAPEAIDRYMKEVRRQNR